MMRSLLLGSLFLAGCASLDTYQPGTTTATATGTGTGTGTGTPTGDSGLTDSGSGGTGTGTGSGTGTGAATGSGTGSGTGTGGTWGTATGSGTGSGTSGTGTGTGSGTGGTGSGTGTGGTTMPPAPLVNGTYTGTSRIFLDSLIPFFGGQSTCNGTATIYVDQNQYPPITGTIDCNWPLLAWVLVDLDDVDAALEGYNLSYGTLNGTFVTMDTNGDGVPDTPSGATGYAGDFEMDGMSWTGNVTTGPRLVGAFSGRRLLEWSWNGSFDVTWSGPLPP